MSGGGSGVAAAAGAASPLMEVEKMSTAGLGYGIAVAVGILVLVSTVMLASYVCVRVHGRAPSPSATAGGRGRVLRAVAVDSSTAAATLEEVILDSNGGRIRDVATDAVQDQAMAQSSGFGSGGGVGLAAAGIHDWSLGSGLDDATLETYPKFCYALQPGKLYSSGGGGGGDGDGDGDGDEDTLCSICLAEYCDGEVLRMLPDCRHSFHATCVDAWLRLHASCPMCRSTSPMPTPVSTPLSELIPLARHPLHGHNYR